jgi:hypothetical protein
MGSTPRRINHRFIVSFRRVKPIGVGMVGNILVGLTPDVESSPLAWGWLDRPSRRGRVDRRQAHWRGDGWTQADPGWRGAPSSPWAWGWLGASRRGRGGRVKPIGVGMVGYVEAVGLAGRRSSPWAWGWLVSAARRCAPRVRQAHGRGDGWQLVGALAEMVERMCMPRRYCPQCGKRAYGVDAEGFCKAQTGPLHLQGCAEHLERFDGDTGAPLGRPGAHRTEWAKIHDPTEAVPAEWEQGDP